MAKPRPRPGFSSIKEGKSSKGRKKVDPKTNLGQLLRKFRDLDEVLYPFLTRTDWVFEDMEYTIEEFSDITGVELEELITEISNYVNKHS